VCALGHVLERSGIPTVCIGLVPQHVARIRPPRALLVPFELGRPFGAVQHAAFQSRVLRQALSLAPRRDVPVADWFPEDAPAEAGDGGEPWACPVTFAAPASVDHDQADWLSEEITLLRPWHDRAAEQRGGSAVGISGMSVEEAAQWLTSFLDEIPGEAPAVNLSVADAFKLAAEDLKLYYLEAASAQPGGSARDLNDWFWTSTAAGRLLQQLRAALQDAEDPALRIFATATLVPAERAGR